MKSKLAPAVRVFARVRLTPRERRALAAAARAAGPLRGPVDIHVVGDAAIRRVNRERLGHDWATDVCTFPMEEPHLWGELVISAATAAREARQRGISREEELALYAIHGVLHLRGFDDRTAAARTRMRAAEMRCLKAWERGAGRRTGARGSGRRTGARSRCGRRPEIADARPNRNGPHQEARVVTCPPARLPARPPTYGL